MPDEASNESVGILNRDTGSNCRRPSTTSTSRKQLTINTDNAAELYAWSQMIEEGVVGEGQMIGADSDVDKGYAEGNVDSHSGEFSIALHHGRRCYYLLFSVEIFTGISVLTFMLQLTSPPKSPLLPAILNDPHLAPTCRHRWAGSLAWRGSPYSNSPGVKTSKQ